nr:MAG TPA: hypothetical protein [Caudoviricetes sp.]
MGVARTIGKALLGIGGDTAEGVGRATAALGKGVYNATTKVVAPATGWALAKGTKGIVNLGRSYASGVNSTNALRNPIGAIVSHANSLSNKMLKYDKDGAITLTNKAKGYILGAGAVAGGIDAMGAYQDTRIGTADPNMYHAAPKIEPRQYSIDNAGADGSLVFALNANRKG